MITFFLFSSLRNYRVFDFYLDRVPYLQPGQEFAPQICAERPIAAGTPSALAYARYDNLVLRVEWADES